MVSPSVRAMRTRQTDMLGRQPILPSSASRSIATGCIMREIHCINIYIQLTRIRKHCHGSLLLQPTKCEEMWGHIVRWYKHNCSTPYALLVLLPFTLWACFINNTNHWGSVGVPPSISALCTQGETLCILFLSMSSPQLLPQWFGNTAEKWSRRKSQFDRRRNYSSVISFLSKCILLSIQIQTEEPDKTRFLLAKQVMLSRSNLCCQAL